MDKKEKDLLYREERLREWTRKLREKDDEYQQRFVMMTVLMCVLIECHQTRTIAA